MTRAVRNRLLPWFDEHQRAMPWRTKRTAYRVWISELMLQQTRVDQVIPYFERFMRAFPTLKKLASSSQQEVLKVWEGLGYYSRARNLHRTAGILVRDHGGRFPASYASLVALPGIGPYTAAAIASLAFNLDHAVLDGNVIRVLSRWRAFPDSVHSTASRTQLQRWADELLIRGDSARFNEAMMELGATCCTPRKPRCEACPMKRICVARQQGNPERYPVTGSAKVVPHKIVGAAVLRNKKGQVLISQRPENAMLGGLWEFPGGTLEPGESISECIARELKEELGVDTEIGERLLIVHHAYSHFTIDLHVHEGRITRGRPRAIECADWTWVRLDQLNDYPFSRADLHIINHLMKMKQPSSS